MARRPRSAAGTTSSLADGLVAATSGRPANPHREIVPGKGGCTVAGCDFAHAAGEHPKTKDMSDATSDSWSDTWQTGAMRPELLDPATGQAKKEAPPLFASANLGDGVRPDLARIVEATFLVDMFADYEDLEANLEVGSERSDYATLREHLDKAEQRGRRAHKLLLGAKIELVRWEADARKVMAAMREKARLQLEDEKADGARKKAIVKDDVLDRIADLYPDEWAAQEIMRAKLKGTCDDLEHLTRQWNSKCASLRTLLETLRK